MKKTKVHWNHFNTLQCIKMMNIFIILKYTAQQYYLRDCSVFGLNTKSIKLKK